MTRKTIEKQVLLSKVERAKVDVDRAQLELERVLGEIRAAPRAEKTTLSRVVEDAFDLLRSAQGELAELEEIITTADAIES